MSNPIRSKKKTYVEFVVSVCVIAFLVIVLCLFPKGDDNKNLPTQTDTVSSKAISKTEVKTSVTVTDDKSKASESETVKSKVTEKSSEAVSKENETNSKTEPKTAETKPVISSEKTSTEQPEITVSKSEPIDNFKKHMISGLTAEQRIVLNQILDGIENFKTYINIKNNVIKRDDTETLISLFVLVKIACIENSSVASTYSYIGNDEYISAFKFTYTKSREKALNEKKKLEKKADSIINGITFDMNEFEKVKYIHDKITKNCVYGELKSGSHDSAYGCLVKGKANCEGYSKAFLLLCNKAGIDCMIVTGTAVGDDGESASHMWNMVMADGKWYHIDLTWDDPTLTPFDRNYVRYDFFNLTDSEILTTHTSEKNKFYKYPKANSVKYNYFIYNDYCGYDFKSACEAMERSVTDAVKSGNKYASIKLNNNKTYASVKKKLFKSSNGETPIFKILKSVKKKTKSEFSAKKISKIFMDQTNVITVCLK